ncbi:MAG: hypothetical protein NTZ14_06920, partial [Hyphomicrobiales bacterium]|nr:hypothetical protein [Hyphomicrobiales bacterium]
GCLGYGCSFATSAAASSCLLCDPSAASIFLRVCQIGKKPVPVNHTRDHAAEVRLLVLALQRGQIADIVVPATFYARSEALIVEAGDWEVVRKEWSLVDISERVSPAQSATRQKINKIVPATISRRGFRAPD